MTDTAYLIATLEMEIAALRSVLSEYGTESDHSCYTQWIKAEALNELRNHLRSAQ
jgi:hypothetical protein